MIGLLSVRNLVSQNKYLILIALRVDAPIRAGNLPLITSNVTSNIVIGLFCTIATKEVIRAYSIL